MTVHKDVQQYYGEILQSTDDLQTTACCTADQVPEWLKPTLGLIHDEVMDRYYGCGLVAPDALEGLSILDLGSGSGRDCYVLSALVGEKGRVVGVDMTDAQLAVANRHRDFHAEQFGYATSNVEFIKGNLDHLDELGLEPQSFDVIISNCVINLCENKGRVLKAVQSLLKPGGEMYFSDVYSDRRIPESLVKDPVLYGECLSGALYWNDFINLAKQAGFSDPRLVESRPLDIENPKLEEKLGQIKFWSATYRLFNLPNLEPACEDYGQAVIYKGSMPNCASAFKLDGHHIIETGKVFPVCGNTWNMLHDSRFKQHFDFIGDFTTHYGIFEGCGTPVPFEGDDNGADLVCC